MLAHIGVIIACWLSPTGPRALFLLNAFVACVILICAANRARYIWASADWPYLGLIGFEVLVLTAALVAFRGQRSAAVTSYIASGLHCIAALAAVVYAFAFKMRLM